MTTCRQLQTRLQAEPATWLVTGVAGFIGSNLLEALRSNWTLTPINQHVLFDLKYVLPAAESDLRL